MPVPPGLEEGIRRFDAEEWFEAHEAWEDHWGFGSPEERDATLGLIKAAVALHHLAARNEAGFAWQAKEAIPRLRAGAPLWPEIDLAGVADALESLVAQARYHGRLPKDWAAPRLRRPA